jgi:methylated-DNA-protein-cysteine methyltransferase-like protein|tara:strand:- start:487 stop:828 length:342 start_codon:yes stop_codon:yes gene_type:complete
VSNFFSNVYEVVKKIPEGYVTSYGAIATYLGAPQSARMVGWAMNASHNLPDVPAHRVVNRNGLLSGKLHFSGTNLMQQLLENEGLTIRDNQILNFKDFFWNPSFHLPPFEFDL